VRRNITLPKGNEDLKRLYLYVNQKINEIWQEYVHFSEITYNPATPKIFGIIFCEMDFYEEILGRIRVHLSEDDILELRRHDAIWDW
jgi:hypothetical protein